MQQSDFEVSSGSSGLGRCMEAVKLLIDFILHIDQHLQVLCATYGVWVYVILFVIVFCETGLVVTPFLPGDSLLFAVGSLAAIGALDVTTAILLLTAAAIIGDSVNYSVGNYVGPKVFHAEHARFLNKEYLHRTHAFYERHGGKTIIIARFLPIIRTFAPFVAGIGSMTYPRFLFFNVFGGLLWVLGFVLAGYWFGNIPLIKKNFSMVILALVLIPGIPAAVEFIRIQMAPAGQVPAARRSRRLQTCGTAPGPSKGLTPATFGSKSPRRLIPDVIGSGGTRFLGRIARRRGATSSALSLQLTSQASMRRTFGGDRGQILHTTGPGGSPHMAAAGPDSTRLAPLTGSRRILPTLTLFRREPPRWPWGPSAWCSATSVPARSTPIRECFNGPHAVALDESQHLRRGVLDFLVTDHGGDRQICGFHPASRQPQ